MRRFIILIILVVAVIGSACGAAPTQTPVIVVQTQPPLPTYTRPVPNPTYTPYPTYTPQAPLPTYTPYPTYTVPPKPTDTPAPTNTLAPTNTPVPTNTTRPILPTSTPQPSNTPRPAATPTPALAGFDAGMRIVGTDMAPGTYRSSLGSGCYWERLSGFGGTLGDILANENSSGRAVVTIAATDKAFNSSRCGRWTLAAYPITSSPTAPFVDGTYIVNKDVAPGTWRSSGTGSCYWARLKGFSGNLDDIIANSNVSGSTVVTIGAGDAGFSCSRCGTWTKVD
jgi:hypothetical protein